MQPETILFLGGFLFFVVAIAYAKLKEAPEQAKFQAAIDTYNEATKEVNTYALAIKELQARVDKLELPPIPKAPIEITFPVQPIQVEVLEPPKPPPFPKKGLGKGIEALIGKKKK